MVPRTLCLLALLLLGACASAPTALPHLTAADVEALMASNAIALFQASHAGGATITLANGDSFSVDLPTTGQIDAYIARRKAQGVVVEFQLE